MEQTSPEYDYSAKVIIIGDSSVGKTSLWDQYCSGRYLDEYRPTIGIEFQEKMVEVAQKKIKLQIWDTCGQERFRSLSKTHYQGAHGVILCYAIDNRESFDHIENWMKDARKYNTEEDACFIIVGTHSDLEKERVVSIDQGKELADSHEIKFFETSARKNLGVDEAFLGLAEDLCEVFSKKKEEPKEDVN